MQNRRQQAEKKGRRAEEAAALFLRGKGYRIIEKRYRSNRGEIDLIVSRGTLTAFVEVKARDSKEKALESITAKQRRRIEATAEDWLKTTGHTGGSLRFDIIAVVPWAIPSHITDAWRLGE
jgi:putative endonuclease